MGFQRDQIVVALRAASGNPDQAVDYLFNGIPENLRNAAAGDDQVSFYLFFLHL